MSGSTVLLLFTNVSNCGLLRQWDDMEMHPGIHDEIHEPVTDEIKHRKGILGVGVCIEVKPYGVFPLYETKSRLRINSPDARFHLRNGVLHLIVPWLDAHADPSLPWTYAVTAWTKACALRTACCASRWLTCVVR